MAGSAGYATATRIRGVEPRFRGGAGGRHEARTTGTPADDVRVVELSGRPFGERVVDRLVALRDGWCQTTFFLTDPESWRR